MRSGRSCTMIAFRRGSDWMDGEMPRAAVSGPACVPPACDVADGPVTDEDEAPVLSPLVGGAFRSGDAMAVSASVRLLPRPRPLISSRRIEARPGVVISLSR